MRALAEFAIAAIDVVRAEVAACRRGAVELLALLLTLVVAALLMLGAVIMLLAAVYVWLAGLIPVAGALLLTALIAGAFSGGLGWLVLSRTK